MTLKIHEDLKQDELLPDMHWLDAGYVTGKALVKVPQEFGVQLIGPTRANYKWQASLSPGFDASQLLIDWATKQALCPEGHTSNSWTPAIDRGDNEVIKIKFSLKDCRGCPSHAKYTRSVPPRRTLTIRPKEQYLALQQAREGDSRKQGIAGYSRATRSRGNNLPRRSSLWHAALPLSGSSQNPLATRRHCLGNQRGSLGSLAQRGSTRKDPNFRFRQAPFLERFASRIEDDGDPKRSFF